MQLHFWKNQRAIAHWNKLKSIISNYRHTCKIAIGDGPTDIEMAKYADIVFARGLLKKFLPQDKEYYEWDDFFDVMDTLSVIIEQHDYSLKLFSEY